MARKLTSHGWFHYKRKYLYLGIKQIDKDIALRNLRDFLSILHKADIIATAGFGSLLGIIRDNDFITWDEDIDLCILKEEEKKLEDALWSLRENGFELVRYERIGLYSFMREGEYIDIYVLQDIGGGIRNCGVDFLFEEDFTDIIKHDFKGITVNIPRNYERHLEFLYGDWSTPVQYADFDMSAKDRFISKAKMRIKAILPDFIFYAMLRRHHMKDLEIFLQKCKDKGIKVDRSKIQY